MKNKELTEIYKEADIVTMYTSDVGWTDEKRGEGKLYVQVVMEREKATILHIVLGSKLIIYQYMVYYYEIIVCYVW